MRKMGEIDEINQVVERMRNTKAIRHLSDSIRNDIEEILHEKEFVEVFEKELNIKHELTDEQIGVIIELLTKEL